MGKRYCLESKERFYERAGGEVARVAMIVEIELLTLIIIVVLMASGAIEMLRQIRDAIKENYQASLARAMSQTDFVVKAEKQKVIKPCVCGHAFVQHWTVMSEGGPGVNGGKCHHTDETARADCGCQLYKPKRGPWPGELKV
jgi:hypothetical protein